MVNQRTNRQWIVPPPTSGANLRLFCLPPAGAGAATYRLWPAELLPEIGVYRIQPPGRESRFRESWCTDINQYTDELMAELLPLLDRPFAFFGHSMGSLVAFHLTQRLQRDYSRTPQHLLVSSFHPPQSVPEEHIHELPQEAFIRELQDRYGGIPDQLLNEPEILELTLPIVRADLTVVSSHKYEPQSPFSCPISVFGGIDDKWVSESQLREWHVQTSGDFKLTMFPGNHYYLDPPQAPLFSALREILT